MALDMDSGRIARYKKDAKADMIRRNMHQIRCPCRSCKLKRWVDPDSGILEQHLLRRGFFEPPANVAREDEGVRREDEESPGQDHNDEGDAGGEDHRDEGDAGGEDHHDEGHAASGEDDEAVDGSANTEIPRSAFQDIHVQELLHKQTSNARAAEREKAKLAQMKKDAM